MYSEGEQFSEINFENIPEIIRIFKIHGSADNTKSILTTLKAVSSKALSEKRRDVIRYLFSTGRHSKVLILGYSCSDEFDITHQIQSIEENQKEILFIEHCNEVEGIEDVRIREQKNPFKKFHGKRVKCNTDNFIEDLWNSFKRTIGKYKPIESKVDWKLYIDDFIRVLKENKECFQYAIVGVTFRSISNFVKAIEYYEKALHIAQSTGDKEEELRNYGNIGNAYMRMGDFKQSLRYFSECLEISNEIGDKVVESACYLVVGTLYNRKGEFQKTVEYYKESLKTFEKLGDRSGIAASYKGLGNAYKRVGDFEKAIEQYEKALKIDKGIEAKIDQSDCYMSLGDVYYNIGYFEKAIEHYLKAEKFLHETGTIHYLEQVYRDLSLVYEKIGGEYKRPCWFSLKENGR